MTANEKLSTLPKSFQKYLNAKAFNGFGALIDWGEDHYTYLRFFDFLHKDLSEKFSDKYIVWRFCGSLHDHYFKVFFNGKKTLKNAASYIKDIWDSVYYCEEFPAFKRLINPLWPMKKPKSDMQIELSSKADWGSYYSLTIRFEPVYIKDRFGNKYEIPITQEEKENTQQKIDWVEKTETLKTLSLEERSKYILEKKVPVEFDTVTRRLYVKNTHLYKSYPTFFHQYLFTLDEKGNPDKIEDLDLVYAELDEVYRLKTTRFNCYSE